MALIATIRSGLLLVVACLCMNVFAIYSADAQAAFVGTVSALSGVGGLSGDNTNDSPPIALGTALYTRPAAIAVGPNSSIVYVADMQTIRELNAATGYARVVAGQRGRVGSSNGNATSEALLGGPTGVCYGNNTIFIADGPNHLIRRVVGGVMSTVAGTGIAGFVNGASSAAQFNNPSAILVNPSNPAEMFVVENVNNAIRLVNLSSGAVSTFLTVNRPRSIAMPADGTFLVVGYIDLSSGTDSILIYFPANATTRVLRTSLVTAPQGIAVDPANNIVFSQSSFIAMLQASTSYSYLSIVSGAGRANGEFPLQSPRFSGMGALCSTSDFAYAFVEGSTNFDVRNITIYPRGMILPWYINVTAPSAPIGNASVMSALYSAAFADLVATLAYNTSITSGSPYIGAANDYGVTLLFNAPAFLNNVTSRAAINASNFTLSKAVTSYFTIPQVLKINFPAAMFPVANASVVGELQAAFQADMRALVGLSVGVSVQSNVTTGEGSSGTEIALYVQVPAFVHNDTTNANLKTYSFPLYNAALAAFNAARPLTLEFNQTAYVFPTNNATVMAELIPVMNTEMNALTGLSTFNFTSVAAINATIVAATGTIPGAIENATTTAALQNATYPTLTAFLAAFHAGKLINVHFPSYIIPAGNQTTMAAVQAAFIADLILLFNSSNSNVTTPSYLSNSSTGSSDFLDVISSTTVGLRATIPGWFYNASTDAALLSSPWTNLYALLNRTSLSTLSFGLDPYIQGNHSSEQVSMNASLVDARRMWSTGLNANVNTVIALMERDLRNYYGFPSTDTQIMVAVNTSYITNGATSGSLVGATWLNWTIQLPYSADTVNRPLNNATFPNLLAYLAALITTPPAPPSRDVISVGLSPDSTFFGGSCNVGCVVGVAIAIAAVIAVLVVIVVLIMSRRKRKANVVAPSFDPVAAKNPMHIDRGEEGGVADVEVPEENQGEELA